MRSATMTRSGSDVQSTPWQRPDQRAWRTPGHPIPSVENTPETPGVLTGQQPQQHEGAELCTPVTATSRTREHYLASLLERIMQADEQALTAFYDATSPCVYGLAWRILQNQTAAEDVLIDVYTQVYQQVACYDPRRGTPSAWLLTLTRSRALDRRRAEVLRQQREVSIDLAATFPASTPAPEEDSAAAELQQVIQTALATLSPEQRQVVEIAYYEGYSHSEIAARLEQPLGTVKTRIRLGLITLRRLLQPILAEQA